MKKGLSDGAAVGGRSVDEGGKSRAFLRVGGQKVAKIVLRWTRTGRSSALSTPPRPPPPPSLKLAQCKEGRRDLQWCSKKAISNSNPFPFQPLTKSIEKVGRRDRYSSCLAVAHPCMLSVAQSDDDDWTSQLHLQL